MNKLALCLVFCGQHAARMPRRTARRSAAGLQLAGCQPGWKHETLALPARLRPRTSPTAGIEELRFPPQFFDPSSPNYWS